MVYNHFLYQFESPLMSHYNNIWHSGASSIHVLHTSLRLRLRQTIVKVNTSCAQLHVLLYCMYNFRKRHTNNTSENELHVYIRMLNEM